MEVWAFGGLGVWKFGGLEVWGVWKRPVRPTRRIRPVTPQKRRSGFLTASTRRRPPLPLEAERIPPLLCRAPLPARPPPQRPCVRSLLVVHELTRIFTNHESESIRAIREDSWTLPQGPTPIPVRPIRRVRLVPPKKEKRFPNRFHKKTTSASSKRKGFRFSLAARPSRAQASKHPNA